MGWQETGPLIERMKFVTEYRTGRWSMTELCERYGVSRPTGYKWVERFEQEGPPGLQDRSRAPQTCPHRTRERTLERLLELKRRFPTFGAKKLRAHLKRERWPDIPAVSTVHNFLERQGLVEQKKTRKKSPHPGKPYVDADAPNVVWAVDFKGEFKTKNGVYCNPLTIMDLHSRYIIKIKGLLSTEMQPVIDNFHDAFRRHGLPDAILSDNGTPFASTGFMGFTKLNVWWSQLGIRHLRTQPSSPQQNGILERMHRELKAAATKPPAKDLAAQQRLFNDFRHTYNAHRPHEALADAVPADLYVRSERKLPTQPHRYEYPQHFLTRTVSSKGSVRFKGPGVYISQALTGRTVGFEEVDDGIWNLYLDDRILARLDERDMRFKEYVRV